MSMLLLLTGSAAAPATVDITAIDTCTYLASCTITGTGFGASQGTITLDGASQTITAWSDTEATFTVARGNSRYGGVTVILTNSGGTSSDMAPGATLAPQTGWDFVNLLDPLATEGERITALPDLAGGDQLAFGSVSGGGAVVTGEAGVDVYDDASVAYDEWVTDFSVEAHDGVTWGTAALQTIGELLTDDNFDLFRRHRYLAFQRVGRFNR